MKIHSNFLTAQDMLSAAAYTGVRLVEFDTVGSRSRAHAFTFSLTGTSSHNRGFGAEGKAATWDEWGIVLGRLFKIDTAAHTGKNGYLSAEHFHWQTGDRFRSLTPADQHKRHRWEVGRANLTGVYSATRCEADDCEAIHRWILSPHKWAEIASEPAFA